MCQVIHYRDFHCNHRWAVIAVPCYPGMGFDTCPDFVDGRAKPLPPRLVARGQPCPKWYALFPLTLRLPVFLVLTPPSLAVYAFPALPRCLPRR